MLVDDTVELETCGRSSLGNANAGERSRDVRAVDVTLLVGTDMGERSVELEGPGGGGSPYVLA